MGPVIPHRSRLAACPNLADMFRLGLPLPPCLARRKSLAATERAQLKAEVFRRDGHQCVYCGSCEELQLDHIDPSDPTDTPGNLVTACATCNQSKGPRTPREWAASSAAKLPPLMRAMP